MPKTEKDLKLELRNAILELPLIELTKLKAKGIDNVPLFKYLGFATEVEMNSWFLHKRSNATPQSSLNEVSKQNSSLKKNDQHRKSSPPVTNDDFHEDSSSTSDDEGQKPLKRENKVANSKKMKIDEVELTSNEESSSDGETSTLHRFNNRKLGSHLAQDDEESSNFSDSDSDFNKLKSNSGKLRHGAPDEEGGRIDNNEDSEDDESTEEPNSISPAVKMNKKARRKAPLEKSSKVQVSRNREVIAVPKHSTYSRDPRFSKQEMNLSLHRNRYEFLEDVRDDEILELKNLIKKETLARTIKGRRGRRQRKLTDEELQEKRATLTKLEQHRAETERAKIFQEKLHELKVKDRELVQKGIKKPFIIGQKQKRELQMKIRFEELNKNQFKLNRFLTKKRKLKEEKSVKEDSKGPHLGV